MEEIGISRIYRDRNINQILNVCYSTVKEIQVIWFLWKLKMTEKAKIKTVLFLCKGNSCRSQIAEALMNHYLPDQWHAFSAGIAPAGYVHPMAIQVLEELGINHQGTSKWVEQFIGQKFDRVITLCGGAENNCPAWLGEGKKEHIGFVDPAQIPGKDEEKLAGFREVRDEMLVSIVDYLKKS